MGEEPVKKILTIIKENKALVIIAVILLLFAYYFVGGIFSGMFATMSELPGMQIDSLNSYDRSVLSKASGIVSQSTDYQIRKGSARIKSEDPDVEYESAKKWAEGASGWVEGISKSDDYSTATITATFRVPSESFDAFIDWILKNYDVKSSNFQLYRQSTERQTDEIAIFNEALNVYTRLMAKVEASGVTDQNLEAIAKITQKKLDVMRLLKQYGYDVTQTERQAAFSAVSLTFAKEKQIKLLPEDTGRTFSMKVRNAITAITNGLMDIVTVPFTVLVLVLKWIVYAITALIPIFIAYRILLKFSKKISEKL